MALTHQTVANGRLTASPSRFDNSIKIDRLTGHHIVAHRFEIDLRALRIKDICEHTEQFSIFGKLCHHQTDQMFADDEIIHFGGFGQFTVTQVEHFADDGEGRLVRFSDIAQVQERDKRDRVRFLRLEVAVCQHNDMIVIRRVEAFRAGHGLGYRLRARSLSDF